MALLTRTGLRINRYCSMSDFPFFQSTSEADYASSSQTLRRSVKTFRRYGRFSILKMAAVRHLGYLKVGNFNLLSHLKAQFASLCQIFEDRSNRSSDMAYFRFSRSRPSAILGFVLRLLGPPTKSICWSLRLCKIWL